MKGPIQIWPFADAPAWMRDQFDCGGDEDWLALVPKHYAHLYLRWADTGTHFGPSEVREFDLADGSKVLVGRHA